jgi:hypothetical protein
MYISVLFDDLVESTLLAGGKSFFFLIYRGQADPESEAVYHGPACSCNMYVCMYVCVGTVSHSYGPTDPLVVA